MSQLNPRALGRRCPPFASPRPQPLAASEMLVTHKVLREATELRFLNEAGLLWLSFKDTSLAIL